MGLKRTETNKPAPQRRPAAVAIQVAVTLTLLIGCAALAIDTGLLYSARAELQRAADATALTGAWELLDPDRMRGTADESEVFLQARNTVVAYALKNPVLGTDTVVHPFEDVLLGRFDSWGDLSTPVEAMENDRTNAVEVDVMRNPDRGGSVALFFGKIFGMADSALGVEAAAAFEDDIIGFQVTGDNEDSRAQLLPFALHVDYWEALTNGAITDDNYEFISSNATVHPGSDGIVELNIYPGAGGGQLPPGNFGTVDLGSPNNSTNDIARQILEGVNADDMSYFGGSITLDETGTLILNGDTGLSAGVKDELAAIVGQPRAIPLFSEVNGPGNNAQFTVVGFAGIRILHVKLTGPMNHKKVIIQPAYVVDSTAVAGTNDGGSAFVYRPPRLIR